MPINSKPQYLTLVLFLCAFLPLCLGAAHGADGVVLQLRNGDRLTGKVLSEATNQIVISTPWAKELIVPLSEITNRQNLALTASPGVAAPAAAKPAPATNAAPAALAKAPAKSKPKLFQKKSWHGKVDIGADLGFSEVSRELYYGRAKVTYVPETAPGELKSIADRFKNTIDYQATYGRNDGVVSANRMDGSSKTDFDIGKRIFVYNLVGAGYDEIRQIAFEYQVGPGVGYRLVMQTNLVLNTEIGFNYQMQYLDKIVAGEKVEDSNERFSVRLAEDATWTISKKLTIDEKLELFPSIDLDGFRLRFESNLRYALWQGSAGESIFLALTLLDMYDTQLSSGVSQNDLQIRSSIGISF